MAPAETLGGSSRHFKLKTAMTFLDYLRIQQQQQKSNKTMYGVSV